MTQAARNTIRTSILTLVLLSLVGCGLMPTAWNFPWTKKPEAPSNRVDELVVTLGDGTNVASYPQFFQRNTLVLDLREITGSGSVVVQPRTGTTWPMRMAIRVRPGQVATVEVSGDERMVFPVTNEGMRTVDLELSPGMYSPTTHQLVVRWSPEPTRIVAPSS
jgi:hypothetical protein